ncbi:E3 ubiquitin-protein ligase TRIM23-like [Zootermopsis nevadensis]|uniref:RING-type E3 ubiquitin transferase n=1 Tax=Zootermopsis nevadensis TaxID=136037 RepID=A0A067RN04_ZOONE|nr:E3 ubiquitin-protein ligase TRIM23-like [Zootermopsis nevadensis]KDR21099.1 GTP-binding protein ARD-1 [Zootermopsis nevadensis]
MAGEIDHFNSYTFTRPVKSNNKVNVLECRVCEDVFGLQGDKVPRLLYCGHTVCHACLLRLPLRDNAVQCPFDRQPTPVGNSGVLGLKKNFALLELLERLQYTHERAAHFYTADLLEKERQLSVNCDEDEHHIAVLYCTVCTSHLCEECSELTHATRTLARHRRVPLSDKPREKPKCPAHPTHIAEFTCLEDDCQTLQSGPGPIMCFICKDYGRHKSHKHALVETEAENIRATVINAVQHMRKFMEDMSETVHKLEQVVQMLEGTGREGGTADLARARVQTYFQQLRETLQLQEVAAMAAVDTHIRERLCSLRQLQEDLSTSVSQMASVCVQCEQTIQQDDTRVLMVGREIKEALNSIEKQQQQYSELSPEQLQPDPSIPITFTKDNRVHIGPKIEMRVVTLGLDGAGKTSVLFKLKQNEFMTMIPTIGFNVETVEYKNLKFTIWDVGGQHKLRPLWKHYYSNTQAVVFVIDSSNHDRLAEAHSELAKLMSEKELEDASLLILANKQDIPGCATIEELTEQFALYKLCCGRRWHIQACDAQSGTGLHDGLDWLSRQIVAAGVYDIS